MDLIVTECVCVCLYVSSTQLMVKLERVGGCFICLDWIEHMS